MDNIIKCLSAFVLSIIVFINCFGNFIGIGDIIPTEPETTVVETTVSEVTTAAPTTAVSEPTTADGNVEITEKPETKEEIVAYFNAVINNAKSNSKSITSNYTKHAVAGDITGIPSVIDKFFGGTDNFVADFMGEDDSKTNVTWTTDADKKAYFPVEGEEYASVLSAEDVKNATIVEKDGKYIIRITTVADARSSDVAHGKGHAPKAFNAVFPATAEDYIPSIVKSLFTVGAVATAYPSSTVTVTVDSATGNVTHADYVLYWTLYIPLDGNDAVLPFSTESNYTVNW